MTEAPDLNVYIDALRDDLPSARDEARIHAKLLSAGLGTSLTLVSKGAAAGVPLTKVSLVSSVWAKFSSLSVISQLSIATAASAVAVATPVWVAAQRHATVPAEATGSVSNAIAAPSMRQAPAAVVSHGPVAPTAALGAAEGASVASAGKPRVKVRPPPSTEPVPDVSALAEETRLLDQALAAIRNGDLTLAAELLDAHAMRFPVARLAHERERARQKLEQARHRLAR